MWWLSRFASSSHQDAADALVAVFDAIEPCLVPGITTRQIDDQVAQSIVARDAIAYSRGMNDFPAHSTTSVNEEVINTIPSQRRLQSGDLLKLQIGLRLGDWHATQSWTYAIGPLTEADAALARVGIGALRAGVAAVNRHARTGDVGAAIQGVLTPAGACPNRMFVGHGIGRASHMDPAIPGSGAPGVGARIRTKTALSVVVLAHGGRDEVDVLDDEWNVVARDGRRSVLFSLMVRVGGAGPEPMIPERPGP